MQTSVSIEDAVRIACEGSTLPRVTETVSLAEAHGRVLSEDMTSKVDDPAFDNSAMDGWAIRIEDHRDECILSVIGVSKAGSPFSGTVGEAEAVQVMTGAEIPTGANAIVMVEDSTISENGKTVHITGPARPNYIRRKGENLQTDQLALESGTHVTPSVISLAATMGYGDLPVVARPLIAVISTGDELISPGEKLAPGQIYESNSFGICALVERMGCEAVRWSAVRDSMDSLRAALNNASESCDAIITSGGVSMGEWDYVRLLMEEEGDIAFWKMQIRPGGPPIFGTWNGVPLFGLPGNPVSSHVVFIVLVTPWISSSLGYHTEHGLHLTKQVRVLLKSSVKGAPGKVCLRRIKVELEGDLLVASTQTHQGSGNIHSLVAHNGLTLLPPNTNGEVGDIVDALLLL